MMSVGCSLSIFAVFVGGRRMAIAVWCSGGGKDSDGHNISDRERHTIGV